MTKLGLYMKSPSHMIHDVSEDEIIERTIMRTKYNIWTNSLLRGNIIIMFS